MIARIVMLTQFMGSDKPSARFRMYRVLRLFNLSEGSRTSMSAINGKKVAILAFGAMLKPALEAGEALDATVANMRFIKPVDAKLIQELASSHDLLVTVEEHQVMGGAGSAVCEALANLNIHKRVLLLGLPDRFVDHGDPGKLLASVGLDGQGIQNSIRNVMPE